MDRVHRLLAAARLLPADPARVVEATAALLDEVWAVLQGYGVLVTLDERNDRWSVTFLSADPGAPKLSVNRTLGWNGLEGRRVFPGPNEDSLLTQEVLLARLVYDPTQHRLVAPEDPEGSALYAVLVGILRAGGLARGAVQDSPEEAGAHLLLSRAFGAHGPQPGEPAALARLLDRALGLLADHRVAVSRPSANFPRWTLSREPSPGTTWTLLVPEPTQARKIYASISESRDGVPTGPTRRLVLAELIYDPAADHLRPRRAADGSALEALLRGMLVALGWNTVEPDRG